MTQVEHITMNDLVFRLETELTQLSTNLDVDALNMETEHRETPQSVIVNQEYLSRVQSEIHELHYKVDTLSKTRPQEQKSNDIKSILNKANIQLRRIEDMFFALHSGYMKTMTSNVNKAAAGNNTNKSAHSGSGLYYERSQITQETHTNRNNITSSVMNGITRDFSRMMQDISNDVHNIFKRKKKKGENAPDLIVNFTHLEQSAKCYRVDFNQKWNDFIANSLAKYLNNAPNQFTFYAIDKSNVMRPQHMISWNYNQALSTKLHKGDEIIVTLDEDNIAITITIITNNVHHALRRKFKTNDTILDVKRAFNQETNIEIDTIHLHQEPQGYLLENNQSLQYYRITKSCTMKNIPRISSRESVEKIEKTTFIKTSAMKKQRYTQFPSLQQMKNGDKTQMKEVQQYTDSILSHKPSGDPADKNTLLHILSGVANENGKKCLFYDSSQHPQSAFMSNSYLNMVDANDDESANFVLTLKHLDDFLPDDNDDAKHATDRVDKIMELKEALSNNQYNETIEEMRRKLSIAHEVAVNRIVITDIYHNGAGIAYRVADLTENEKNNIITQTQKLENKMKKLFVDYDKCAIHPALFHQSYDISMFDELGNKTFGSSENSTYKVGPSGKERDYVQPAGWTRYGLKVLNKYPPNNKWLDPFQDPGNWYRAFHGTSREAGSSIYKGAFKSGSCNAYGKGIYCSPDVNIAADYCRSRGGIITLETKKGKKDFYFVFQVAVNPDTMNNAAYIPNFNPSCENAKYWIAPTGADIRPYGILIKEV